MARPIILAMEEYEGTDPNDFDFSDFEPVMDPSEGSLVSGGMGDVVDAIDDIDTHTEIVDIIAIEGVGNRPQIAAIALSALETRLFGQPVVGTRVGTESRTRIATEGKNFLVRAWDAILKFFNKIAKWFKSIFSSDKKEKVKKKKKEIEKAIEVISESSITEDLKNNDGVKDINIPITIMIGSVNLGNGENPKPDGIISPKKTGAAIEYIRKFFFKDLDLKGISQLVKDTSNGVLEGAKQKDYDTVKSKIDKLNETMDFTRFPNFTFPGFMAMREVANEVSMIDLKDGFKDEADNINNDPTLKAEFLEGMFNDQTNKSLIIPLCDEIIKRAPDEKELEALIEETRKAVDANKRSIARKLHTDAEGKDAGSLVGEYLGTIKKVLALMTAYSKYIIAEYKMVDGIHQLGESFKKLAEAKG